MEDNEILKVLYTIEKELQSIKSAKEQVDAVLEADGNINQNLSAYSTQLGTITKQLGSLKRIIESEIGSVVSFVESEVSKRLDAVSNLISSIEKLSSEAEAKVKEATNGVVDDFKTSCENVTQAFDTKIGSATSSFENKAKEATDKFTKESSEYITKLINAVTELKDSSTTFLGAKDEITKKIGDINQALSEAKSKIDHIDNMASSISTSCTTLTQNQEKANGAINQVLENIKQSNQTIQQCVKKTEENFLRSNEEQKIMINSNKKILFGVILLVIIDIVLRFI